MVSIKFTTVCDTLRDSAYLFIPKHEKNFYKFWWSQELDQLKLNVIVSCRAWKDASKPRHGTIFSKFKQDKLLHRKRIREEQFHENKSYTNNLHEALLCKSERAGKLNLKIKILILYK